MAGRNTKVSFLAVIDPNHVLPKTYEWNAALEQSFGNADVLTLTYVGAAGRKLMRQDIYESPNPNFTYQLYLMTNGADSSYNSLQVQYRHRLTHGLQTLLSYTWAHAIDDVSSDVNYANVPPGAEPASENRGSSDYDIRNTFADAVSYDIPGPHSGWSKPLLENWSVNSIVYARSAPPVNVVTKAEPLPDNPLSGANSVQGDLGRNALRGFGATQDRFHPAAAVRAQRVLPVAGERRHVQHLQPPNFGSPVNSLSSPPFGQATQTLNSYLGSGGQSGGLNPLYQIGAPRSIQLALSFSSEDQASRRSPCGGSLAHGTSWPPWKPAPRRSPAVWTWLSIDTGIVAILDNCQDLHAIRLLRHQAPTASHSGAVRSHSAFWPLTCIYSESRTLELTLRNGSCRDASRSVAESDRFCRRCVK